MSARSPVAARSSVVPRHPIHAALAPFPAVCFSLTLLTDVAYWQTGDLMWKTFSEWLLFAGLVTGALAAIAGIVGMLRRRGRASDGWMHGLGSLAVLALAFVNSLLHAGDGWSDVVPWGVVLSGVTVALVIVTAWMGRSALYREIEEVRGHA